jgi:hypothetical protein
VFQGSSRGKAQDTSVIKILKKIKIIEKVEFIGEKNQENIKKLDE